MPTWWIVSTACRTRLIHWKLCNTPTTATSTDRQPTMADLSSVQFNLEMYNTHCAVTVYRCLYSVPPPPPEYLSELLIPLTSQQPRYSLRSASCNQLNVPSRKLSDLSSAWLVDMYTFLHYFPVSLSHSMQTRVHDNVMTEFNAIA